MRLLRKWPCIAIAAALALAVGAESHAALVKTEVRIGIIGPKSPPPPLYELDPVPEDEAFAGARQAIVDNNTTGAFMGQHYTLDEAVLTPEQSPADEAKRLVDGGANYLVLNLPADQLLAVADAVKDRGVVVFNAGAPDDRLRAADCRANIFHIIPNRGMLTDGLAQFLVTRKWPNIFLITGPNPGDKLYAAAMRRSAKKFGLKIAADTDWTFGPLARARGDSVVQSDALVFTRGTNYDVMVVSDEAADFGDFISYNTWDPKFVAGTQGLVAASWHRALDAWGAAQLQSRFYKAAKRFMRPADYHAWVAVRAVGEAVTRAKSADPRVLADFMLTPKFQIAAFKGVPVSFRPWDHQLRQPVLLAQPMRIVSVSPQQGFLHQKTPLDTMGFDGPENACTLK